MLWRFVCHIKNLEEFDDALANAVYEQCQDSSLFSSGRKASAGFDREAPTLQAAIRSAMADLANAGLDVSSVEIVEEDLVELPQ